MSSSTPESVISGMPYPVESVNGHPCERFDDFTGDAAFAIDNNGPYLVQGCGSLDGDHLRFYEKDHAGTGKDVRVWRIARTRDGGFTAEHTPAAW